MHKPSNEPLCPSFYLFCCNHMFRTQRLQEYLERSKTLHRGTEHQYNTCWPTLGPFMHPKEGLRCPSLKLIHPAAIPIICSSPSAPQFNNSILLNPFLFISLPCMSSLLSKILGFAEFNPYFILLLQLRFLICQN